MAQNFCVGFAWCSRLCADRWKPPLRCGSSPPDWTAVLQKSTVTSHYGNYSKFVICLEFCWFVGAITNIFGHHSKKPRHAEFEDFRLAAIDISNMARLL